MNWLWYKTVIFVLEDQKETRKSKAFRFLVPWQIQKEQKILRKKSLIRRFSRENLILSNIIKIFHAFMPWTVLQKNIRYIQVRKRAVFWGIASRGIQKEKKTQKKRNFH